MKKDEKQKADIIRTYALNQLASIPTMFRGKQLKCDILCSVISFLVHLNYYSKSKKAQSDDIHQLAQFKLYAMVQVLYNVKVGQGEAVKKGLKNADGQLWILEVNSQIQKQAKKQTPLLQAHNDTLDFIA